MSHHAAFQSYLLFSNRPAARKRSVNVSDAETSSKNFNAKAAHRASPLSWRQALNHTVKGAVASAVSVEISFAVRANAARSCFMNEDLPDPQSPSIERVSGGNVPSFKRKRDIASTY